MYNIVQLREQVKLSTWPKNNWRAPSKRGVCTYFVVIFQVARNPLKFGVPILFVLKNVPVFFSKAEKHGPNCTKPALPPPSPCVRLQTELKHCACVCFTPLEGGGGKQKGGLGVGWTFKRVFEALFPRLWKKTQGHFLTQRESACQISADSEQLEKSQRNRYTRLSLMEPFNLLNSYPFLPIHKLHL